MSIMYQLPADICPEQYYPHNTIISVKTHNKHFRYLVFIFSFNLKCFHHPSEGVMGVSGDGGAGYWADL